MRKSILITANVGSEVDFKTKSASGSVRKWTCINSVFYAVVLLDSSSSSRYNIYQEQWENVMSAENK